MLILPLYLRYNWAAQILFCSSKAAEICPVLYLIALEAINRNVLTWPGLSLAVLNSSNLLSLTHDSNSFVSLLKRVT